MTPLDRKNPPRLDRGARDGTLSAAGVRARSREPESVATGVLLLWHDHWDAAHEIAQSDEGDSDHDLLHAIVHRREGDFANSGYWLRGAGAHPCFDSIAPRVEPLLAKSPLLHALLPNGKWSPSAFLKAVEKGRGGPDEPLLRTLQAEELITFYEWLAR